jgi:hypothetical protein
MTDAHFLRRSFVSLEVNELFTEAALTMRDGSRLVFCHRVGERRAGAVGAGEGGGEAGQVLARVALFRLNARHLDVRFADGSRWQAPFRDPGKGL